LTKRLIIQKKALYICPEQNAQRQILTLNSIKMKTKQKAKINPRVINHPENDKIIIFLDRFSKILMIPVIFFFLWVFTQIFINS
jgi:hypothetical protein